MQTGPGRCPGATGRGEPDFATNTWRHLRLAMVGLVLVLGLAVLVEHAKVKHGCLQPSISAYFYTPVRGIFVSALVALGVCLICLRGNTDLEDLLLNIAGMVAPIVAFVPTPHYTAACTSVPAPIEHVSADIANNVVALLVLTGPILLLTVVALSVAQTRPAARLGVAVGGLLWLVVLLVFLAARHAFTENAHYVAASVLFLCIVGAAVDNAVDTTRPRLKVVYIVLAATMVLALGTILIVGAITGWRYWTILLEVVVLALFVIFWLVQTADLWHGGIRPRTRESRAAIER